ncbi:MAG TPA: hypothetical protein VGK48_05640 [Terriglobia bacterium]|jgi:hypothetical protein
MMLIAWLIIAVAVQQSAPVVPAASQSVDDVLAAVSRNVKDFQDLLPDFVCDEKITSTAYESGKIKDTKMVDSVFTALQKPSPGPRNGLLAFTETRDIFAIDTRPVPKGTKMPGLPLAMFGGFSALLSMTFSPQNLAYHKYELEHADDRGRLVIHFATKENQLQLRTYLNGEALINKDSGTAWIDTASMQVARLERNFLSLPHAFRQLRNTVEYSPTNFGDRQFWLPRSMRTDVTDRDAKKTKSFLAEYSNCKRFTTDIKIVP